MLIFDLLWISQYAQRQQHGTLHSNFYMQLARMKLITNTIMLYFYLELLAEVEFG